MSEKYFLKGKLCGCLLIILQYVQPISFCLARNNSQESTGIKNSGWYWSRPVPTGNMLYSVQFMNGYTGYAAGALGTIIKTTNGGKSWMELNSGTTADLSVIHFINENTGFAAGKSGIMLKTSDGGNEWTSVHSGTSTFIHDIDFPDKSTGYCAGLHGTILKSRDGGSSWIKVSSGSISPLFCIDFLNVKEGTAGGYNIILRTTDGGKNWSEQNVNFPSSGSVTGISYIDHETIYAACNIPGGVFYKTTNSGLSWESHSLELPALFGGSVDLVRSMSFVNASTGFIVTDFGTICKTTDGGNIWKKDSTFRPGYIKLSVMYDISINVSGIISIAGCGGTVIRSTNAGQNWLAVSGNKNMITSSYFVNTYMGFAAGVNGCILKTKNGGKDWIEMNNITSNSLNTIFFLNESTGFVAGDSGCIFKTTNAGYNWTDQTNYRRYNINTIRFTNDQSGIAAGGNPENERAFIYKTADGGSSWYEAFDSLGLGVINTADFMNEAIGIAAGNNGNILYTYDAGESWIPQNISPENFYSVSFYDNQNGLISGGNGIVCKTSNAGISWNTILSGQFTNLTSVKFYASELAIAAGHNGTIIYSYNGGYNWNLHGKITDNDLYSLSLNDDDLVLAFGEHGTVIYSNIKKSVVSEISGSSRSNNENYLLQNFPNPFNPETNLEFRISKNEFVSLKIYDVLGKEIRILVNEIKPAGQYTAAFDGGDLPGGIYFYRIEAGTFKQTRRMVLIK